jgi:ribonuclease-3
LKFPAAITSLFAPNKTLVHSIKNMTGFYPGNISLYTLAFSHRSTAKETEHGAILSNERLEYLGDAVLGAVVADLLFKKFPYRDEGFLTEMRAKIVSRENLKNLAMKMGINHLVVNNADAGSFRSMYGDALEAFIGAIYLDKGYSTTQKFIVTRIIKNHVDLDYLEKTDLNFKSKIINWAQKERKSLVFETMEENSETRLIKVRLLIDDKEIATGEDFSKKKAEQTAAEKACIQLKL